MPVAETLCIRMPLEAVQPVDRDISNTDTGVVRIMLPELGSNEFPIRLKHETIVIGIPVYNEERYIGDTLKSLQDQTWRDFLVLISDNCSSDNTTAICKHICEKDDRFHFVSQKRNIGSAENFNFLRKSTKSPLFMWLGAHDLVAPDFLKLHIGAMLNDEGIALSYSDFVCIDENGTVLSVQSEHNTSHFARRPVLRALLCLKQTGMCVQVNQVIRRSAIAERDFSGAWGTDRVMLSSIAYRGAFNAIRGDLYQYRGVTRESDYMERLTGQKVAISKSELVLESREFFRSVAKGRAVKAVVAYLSDAIVQHRFGARPRNVLAYLWDTASTVRAWFR